MKSTYLPRLVPVWLSLVVLVPACAGTPRAGDEAPLLTLERVVRLEHRLVNHSDQPATLEMFMALPQGNERQTVRFVAADPGFVEELRDDFGNRVLHYVDEGVPPGEVIVHGWIAEVAISNYVFQPGDHAVLSDDERGLYLRDSENYGLTTDTIQDLAAELCEDLQGDEAKVRAIFRHLIGHVTYYRDDVWDPAPQVIERGTGSCSEFNYALIALCRAAGIPTRWTGGITLKRERRTAYDEATFEDAVFHRWSETFLGGRGWFPVDCSRGAGEIKRIGNPENYYGRLPAGLLQCVRGDGAGSPPMGWSYISRTVTPYEGKPWSGKAAFWIEGVRPGALEARLADTQRALAGSQTRAVFDELVTTSLGRELLFFHRSELRPEALSDLVAALRAVGHPGAVYWSLLGQHRGQDLEADRRYQEFCDAFLLEEIHKHYVTAEDDTDLFTFEYWWRKARPYVRWDAAADAFVLTSKSINIY